MSVCLSIRSSFFIFPACKQKDWIAYCKLFLLLTTCLWEVQWSEWARETKTKIERVECKIYLFCFPTIYCRLNRIVCRTWFPLPLFFYCRLVATHILWSNLMMNILSLYSGQCKTWPSKITLASWVLLPLLLAASAVVVVCSCLCTYTGACSWTA